MLTTEMQSGKRSHTHSLDASDRTRSLVLPKITVEPGPVPSQHQLSDADSFSISSKSEKQTQQFFPKFDGTKESSEYPQTYDRELPWDEDTLAGLPPRLR